MGSTHSNSLVMISKKLLHVLKSGKGKKRNSKQRGIIVNYGISGSSVQGNDNPQKFLCKNISGELNKMRTNTGYCAALLVKMEDDAQHDCRLLSIRVGSLLSQKFVCFCVGGFFGC